MSISHGPKSISELQQIIYQAWLHAKVAFECELCGNNSWTVIADDSHDGLAIRMRAGSNGQNIFAPTFLVYAVQCNNCGNVRQQSKDAIERMAAAYREAERQKALGPLGLLGLASGNGS